MVLIYVLLACLAVVFFASGFSVHAFCFAERKINALRGEVEKLQRLLGDKQSEVTEAQDEIAQTSALVRSMQRQVRNRQRELEGLQEIAARQEREIASLQRDAEAIRTALVAAGTVSLGPAAAAPDPFHRFEAPLSAGEAGSWTPLRKAAATPSPQSPEWRNNLDTILESLDKMGNAIEGEG